MWWMKRNDLVVLIYISLMSKSYALFPVLIDHLHLFCEASILFHCTSLFPVVVLFYFLTGTPYVFSGYKLLGF